MTVLQSPRRLRAKYTPRTNLTICTPGISPLQGASINIGQNLPSIDTEKIAPQFSVAVPPSNAIGTAATAMPPELRKAHQANDRAVMQAYGFDVKSMTESSCVAELMKMYQKLVSKDVAD